jgi:peptidoglycan/LPS O-acetylase OafA/YrhL
MIDGHSALQPIAFGPSERRSGASHLRNAAATGARIPELDGLRGVAVLSVVLAHYLGDVQHRLPFLDLGWVGVCLFFVLSGFLIGSILLEYRDVDNYLVTFYARRAFRIFPIYYLVIVLTLFSSLTFGDRAWLGVHWPALTYFLYAQNVMAAFAGRFDGSLLGPTWTLAVEEQFYLLIPLAIRILPRRHLARVVIGAILLAPALRYLFLAWSSPHATGGLLLLPCRWDALLLGVLAALIRKDPRFRSLVTLHRTGLRATALAALCFVPISLLFGAMIFLVAGQFCLAVFCAAFLLLTVDGAAEGARFRSTILAFFGRISYGLYLIHQPIAIFMHGTLLGTVPDIDTPAQCFVTLAALMVSIAAAWLSWIWFEAPLIGFGHRWRYGTAHS